MYRIATSHKPDDSIASSLRVNVITIPHIVIFYMPRGKFEIPYARMNPFVTSFEYLPAGLGPG